MINNVAYPINCISATKAFLETKLNVTASHEITISIQ